MRNKFLLIICLIAIAAGYRSSSRPVYARQSNNVVGVNLACRWNPEVGPEVQALVQPGGWMVIMATPGDAGRLQELLNKLDQTNSQLNVVIRLDKSKQSFTPEDAAAWIATFGSLETDRTLFVMPWNEPNQAHCRKRDESGNCLYWEYTESTDLDGKSPEEVARQLKEYTDAFNQHLTASGLRTSGRVFLLSPMFNQTHYNYRQFLGYLGGGSYYQKFDGIAMNLYDFWASMAQGPNSHPNLELNAAKYRTLLNDLGIPSNKPVFAVESGLVWPFSNLGVVYQDGPMTQTIQSGAETNTCPGCQRWADNPNFDMFAVFSYDPEWEEPWDIFTAPQTREYFRALGSKLGGRKITGGPPDPNLFNPWLTGQLGNIISCPTDPVAGITSYASDEILCNSVCGTTAFKPGIEIVDPKYYTASPGDPIRLYQKPGPSLSRTSIARGGMFKQFTGLTIPFAQDLARFLAGPFLMQGVDEINNALQKLKEEGKTDHLGVLAKLTPADLQDKLRLDYYQKCDRQEYAPTECILPDGLMTGIIPDPLPQPTDEKYQVANGLRKYQQDLAEWNRDYREIWNLIPLVPNRIAEVANAINMSCDPCPTEFSSTVKTQTPWVYGLWRTSDILHNLLMPEIPEDPDSTPETENNYQCVQPEISAEGVVSGGPADPVLVLASGDEAKADIYGPIKDVCENNPDYLGSPPCGQSCNRPSDCGHSEITCNQFGVCVPEEVGSNICQALTCGEGFDDPTWAIVNYPYLNEIYQNLSGEQGIFQIWVASALKSGMISEEDVPLLIAGWDNFAESGLNYCFEPYSSGDADRPSLVLTKEEGLHELQTIGGETYPALCGAATPDLKVYPRFIGGVAKALDWVINKPLAPIEAVSSGE